MKSWQTTVAGVTAILAIVVGVVKVLTDGDPATNPDWNAVVAGLSAGVVGLCARDNKVSSEQAGVK
jgi:hypothetical protein